MIDIPNRNVAIDNEARSLGVPVEMLTAPERADLLQVLIKAENDAQSQMLTGPLEFLVIGVADEKQYPLPDNCGVVKDIYYSGSSLSDLRVAPDKITIQE